MSVVFVVVVVVCDCFLLVAFFSLFCLLLSFLVMLFFLPRATLIVSLSDHGDELLSLVVFRLSFKYCGDIYVWSHPLTRRPHTDRAGSMRQHAATCAPSGDMTPPNVSIPRKSKESAMTDTACAAWAPARDVEATTTSTSTRPSMVAAPRYHTAQRVDAEKPSGAGVPSGPSTDDDQSRAA